MIGLECLLRFLQPARLRCIRATATTLYGTSTPAANTMTEIASWQLNHTAAIIGISLSSAVAATSLSSMWVASLPAGEMLSLPASGVIAQNRVLLSHVVLQNISAPAAAPYLTQNVKTQKLYFPTPVVVDSGNRIALLVHSATADSAFVGSCTFFWVIPNKGLVYVQSDS